jgi:hypothetical protein
MTVKQFRDQIQGLKEETKPKVGKKKKSVIDLLESHLQHQQKEPDHSLADPKTAALPLVNALEVELGESFFLALDLIGQNLDMARIFLSLGTPEKRLAYLRHRLQQLK